MEPLHDPTTEAPSTSTTNIVTGSVSGHVVQTGHLRGGLAIGSDSITATVDGDDHGMSAGVTNVVTGEVSGHVVQAGNLGELSIGSL